MFTKIAVVACLVGLAQSGALQNSALNYGLSSGYPGSAGAYTGYAGTYPGYAGLYPGYAGLYPGYAGLYPGYTGVYPSYGGAYSGLAGAYRGMNGGLATSYVNVEKYTAPRAYNAAYNVGTGLNGLYGGAYESYGAGVPYGGYGGYGYSSYQNRNQW